MRKIPDDAPKSPGSPFARPSCKPWLVEPPSLPWPLAVMAVTTEVFFRHNFGESYMTSRQLVRGAFHLGLFAVALRFAAGGWRFSFAAPVALVDWLSWLIFSLLFLVTTSLHLFFSVRRSKKFPDEYSLSDGRPWEPLLRFAPFVRDEWDFELYFEPNVCIALGGLLIYFHDWFGIYLIMAGCGNYLSASKKWAIRRALELNVMDGNLQTDIQPNFKDEERRARTASIKSIITDVEREDP